MLTHGKKSWGPLFQEVIWKATYYTESAIRGWYRLYDLIRTGISLLAELMNEAFVKAFATPNLPKYAAEKQIQTILDVMRDMQILLEDVEVVREAGAASLDIGNKNEHRTFIDVGAVS